jgi:sugar lactone lactonase YvrE
MKKHDCELIVQAESDLGEGAIWDGRKQLLYWLDIEAGKLNIFDPSSGENRTLSIGQPVGTVVPCKSGGLLLALQHGLAHLDPETEQLTLLMDPEEHLPDNRFNDGKCDPAGRFWVGTMRLDSAFTNEGSLYCLDLDGTIHKRLEGVSISNGLAWSQDQATMYYIDSPTREVAAFDYDVSSGMISNRRSVVSVPEEWGMPDGMTIDTEGRLWVAQFFGYGVYCYDPITGELLEKVEVPSLAVTTCAFGGSDLATLYITTARVGTSDEQLREYPLAGSLFQARPGVKGVAAYEYNDDLQGPCILQN